MDDDIFTVSFKSWYKECQQMTPEQVLGQAALWYAMYLEHMGECHADDNDPSDWWKNGK